MARYLEIVSSRLQTYRPEESTAITPGERKGFAMLHFPDDPDNGILKRIAG
jgi:hypothetical protein